MPENPPADLMSESDALRELIAAVLARTAENVKAEVKALSLIGNCPICNEAMADLREAPDATR